ncbi:MAG: DUF4389 domain-containing protein [Leptolyngbya sp. SIO3F4]|nr:DUF4389 domain-containing protein [Leptolyngbya sp. SIO3F4]
MVFEIKHQESYSRAELLLRFFFGAFYIVLPHIFLLMFVGIAAQFIILIAFFAVLFTGSFPQSMFVFVEKYLRWNLRVNARLWNLCDGYPAFGLDAEDEYVRFEVEYPEKLSRGLALLKFFLGGFYCALPHVFVLMFRLIANAVLRIAAFWVVLFTGAYPESWHNFNVGTLRWVNRVNLYLLFMTDQYPPFTGMRLPEEEAAARGGMDVADHLQR